MKGRAADLRHGGVGANIQRFSRTSTTFLAWTNSGPAAWSTPFVTVASTLISSAVPASSACGVAARRPRSRVGYRRYGRLEAQVMRDGCSSAMCPRSKAPRPSTSPRSLKLSPAPTTASPSPASAPSRPRRTRPYPRRRRLPPLPRRLPLPVTRPTEGAAQLIEQLAMAGGGPRYGCPRGWRPSGCGQPGMWLLKKIMDTCGAVARVCWGSSWGGP